jgi:hypothetical protein
VSEDAGIEPEPAVSFLRKVAAILALGSEHLLNRKGIITIIAYRKEMTRVPFYKYRGFGVYSMNKSGGRRIITRAIAAS